MKMSDAVEQFMRFCNDANLDYRQINHSMRKYLLAYQRNLVHRAAFSLLFGDAFINWQYVEQNLPKVDCAHWLAVFRFIDFSKVQQNKSVLQNIE